MINLIKYLLFILLQLNFLFAQNTTKLQSGDLLFLNIDCGEMCTAINAVTEGYNGKKFNHVGIVSIDNDHKIWVYEAIENGVVKTPLNLFLNYTKHPIYVGRVIKKHQKLIKKVLDFCEKQLGTAYDHDFLYNNGKYYCSELVYDAFLYANNNQAFFQMYPMNYKAPNSNEFYPVWVNHFKKKKSKFHKEN